MKEIPQRERIMALLSPPSLGVWLTVDDARWIRSEIKRLRQIKALADDVIPIVDRDNIWITALKDALKQYDAL